MNDLAQRRDEDKARRREQILDAAAWVAARDGVAGFSMDQVARQARLSRALLYVYFHDKQDLLLGLADRANHKLAARFAAVNARKFNGLKKVQHMGLAYVAFASEEPVYFDAMSSFAAQFAEGTMPEGNELLCMQGCERVFAEIITALNQGMNDGSIRNNLGNLMLVAFTLWAFMYGVVQVIATKGHAFQFFGLKTQQLVDHAIALSTQSLVP